MQRPDYLCKPRDEPVIVPSEPQKALDLSDDGWGGPLFDNTYFLFIGHYTLGRDDMPQVCDLSVEELTFWGFIVWPVPASGRWPPDSWDGWLDLLRRWLYCWGIWCTNWGWGPWGRSSITAERWQGCWLVWKTFCYTHGIPMALLWMMSVICSPCPSQPASTQTSGQVMKTIGVPANYWGFWQCRVASRHPWWSNISISWGQCRTSGFHLSFRLWPLY